MNEYWKFRLRWPMRERCELFPAVRDTIVAKCPGTEDVTRDAIRRWEMGRLPSSRYEEAVFVACKRVRDVVRNGIDYG